MICKMRKSKSNKKGFTLIEVIVSLVLIGILVAIAGMGLIQISEGYVFSKKNAETVQKAQVAMTRIIKELSSATNISAAGANSITFARPESATTSTTNTIDLSSAAVRIQVGANPPSTLIDSATAFTLAYVYDAAGTTIRQIDITLTVRGANNELSTFNNRITTLAPY